MIGRLRGDEPSARSSAGGGRVAPLEEAVAVRPANAEVACRLVRVDRAARRRRSRRSNATRFAPRTAIRYAPATRPAMRVSQPSA
jgi:hypothetical protein